MFKDYFEVRDWLEEFIPYTYSKKNLGLERITKLCELLGNPQKKFKSIHVGGTSGKGSTAFYIAQLLRSCKLETRNSKLEINSKSKNSNFQKVSDLGFRNSNFRQLKVGFHLSPHLVYIGERMWINNKPIKVIKLIKLVNQIKPVVEKIQRDKPDLTPSYFEILVGASFLYFAQEKVDFAVVEVGLGGRLDATNVLQPLATVITNVGMDHTDILGKTIEKIAYEKAGIIKSDMKQETRNKKQQKGIPVVTAAREKALKIIEKVAREKNAPLIKIDVQKPEKSLNIDIFSNNNLPIDIFKSNADSFAISNKILALAVVKTLGIPLKKNQILKAFNSIFPGRLENIEKDVVLDGAHNPDKIRAFSNTIKDSSLTTHHSSLILVVAFKRGKEWKKMLDLLMKEISTNNTNVKFQIERVIATKFHAVTDTGKFGAVNPKLIKNYITKKYSVGCTVVANSQEAVFEAINRVKSQESRVRELILVTGSLYLVGEVRTMWKLPKF